MDATELELIQRAQRGDEAAFELLLAPVMSEALRLAYGMLQRRCDAEDCVQEAARLSWQRLGNLRPDSPFRPWFRAIVVNQCREAWRDRWRSVRWLSDRHPASEGDWLAGEDLRRALAALPHRYRVAIVLRFYVGLSEAEVAETLGLRTSGVGARINRGLRRLRASLANGR